MQAHVHIAACPEYERAAVRRAVRESWERLLSPDFIAAGMTVVLKPNIINDMPPERAVCTHPEIVRAVAEVVLEAGGRVIVADQPGYALGREPSQAFARTGMLEACADLPIQFELLARGGYQERELLQAYRFPRVQYAARLLEADRIINLPKAKTHNQTLLTAAIKNMFGAVAPRQRLEAHLLMRYWALSEAIVDCYAIRPPDFHLADAIDVMEGLGPTQGRPRRVGFLAASTDGVALDTILSKALGYEPHEIATTVAAHNIGLGEMREECIALTGTPLSEVAVRLARAPVVHLDRLSPLARLLRGIATARPKISRKQCRACGACAGICPIGAIHIEGYARVNYERCVQCFCCMEACPFDAIQLRRSWLFSLAQRLPKALGGRS